jgi:hypothetical protein
MPEQKVILLVMNAINALNNHLWSLYASALLTFEHHPRRIFARHALRPNVVKGISGGAVSLGLRDARSGLFALATKEISFRVWKDAKS